MPKLLKGKRKGLDNMMNFTQFTTLKRNKEKFASTSEMQNIGFMDDADTLNPI